MELKFWYQIVSHYDDGTWYELIELYNDGYKCTVAYSRDYAYICHQYNKANAIAVLGLVGVAI